MRIAQTATIFRIAGACVATEGLAVLRLAELTLRLSLHSSRLPPAGL